VREGIAEHVFTVSSADFMAIYAANNLFKGIERFSNSGGALLGGIIANSMNTDFQHRIIDDFAARTKTQIVQYVPRSLAVTQAELQGKTTIEAAPQSAQADVYRALAKRIAGHTESTVPAALAPRELREWSASWADQLIAMEPSALTGMDPLLLMEVEPCSAREFVVRWPDQPVAGLLGGKFSFA